MILKTKELEGRHYVEPMGHSDMIGAYGTMLGIKDSLTLLHGTIGCNLWGRGVLTYDFCDENEISCTGLAEQDVIFGGEERLRAAIKRAVKVLKPAIICVAPGTVGALIGDDVDGVVNATRSELAEEGIPIINVPTSVLDGDTMTGFNLVLEALVDRVVEEPTQDRSRTVNIFGVKADVPNAEADVAEMKRLLGELGIQIQEVFCCKAEVDRIRHASESNLNLVVSEVMGVEAARKMEQRFGQPFRVLPYPIGITNTKCFLKAAAGFFGIEKERVDGLIAREAETVYRALRRAMFAAGETRGNPLIGATAAIVGDSTHVLSVTRFLIEEWGVKPVLLVLRTYGEASLEMLTEMEKELGVEIPVLLNPPFGAQIKQVLEETKPQIVLGGNHEKFMIRELGLDRITTTFVHIGTYPNSVDTDGRIDIFPHPFAGFQGVIYLTELITNELVRSGWDMMWANFPGEGSALEMARQGKLK